MSLPPKKKKKKATVTNSHIANVFFFFFFFFFLGGRDIHYKDAMKETTSVCEGHPQQKLQATCTT